MKKHLRYMALHEYLDFYARKSTEQSGNYAIDTTWGLGRAVTIAEEHALMSCNRTRKRREIVGFSRHGEGPLSICRYRSNFQVWYSKYRLVATMLHCGTAREL